MKRVEKDGKFYRLRRGKLVEIPAAWVGEVVYSQTIRERPSKLIGKLARTAKCTDKRKDRSMAISVELAAEELKRKPG